MMNVEELDYVLPTGSIKPRDEEGLSGARWPKLPGVIRFIASLLRAVGQSVRSHGQKANR